MSVAVDLSGRSVLITGAAGDLGFACAKKFVEAGAMVTISDISSDDLEQRAADLAELKPELASVPADITSPEQCRKAVAAVRGSFGRIDSLVSCAGVDQNKPLLDLSEADWRRIVDVNLSGTFFITQAAGEAIVEDGGGSIVTMASIAARSGRPLAAHYAASKAALLSLTKSAALAFAPTVRVNAVCPGRFLTRMLRGVMEDRDTTQGKGAGQRYLEEAAEKCPLGRLGEAEELALAVLFLASDSASYMTGQAINVDGGVEMD